METIKFSDMNIKQIEQYINDGNSFTTNTISVDQAIELFDSKVHPAYKSYFLLENVLPKEFLSNKHFMQSIITKRYPFKHASVLSYASWELKADAQLVTYAIMEHGMSAVQALINYDQQSNYKNEYNVAFNNGPRDKGYKSRLLEDPRYVTSLIVDVLNNNDENFTKYLQQGVLRSLVKNSDFINKTDKIVEQLIKLHPIIINDYRGNKKEQMALLALKTRSDNNDYDYIHFNKKEYPTTISNLMQLDEHVSGGGIIKQTIIKKALKKGIEKTQIELDQKQNNDNLQALAK